ncbi:MAG: FAD-dependent oxidoreductase [Marmoricola sp.]
MPYVVTQACCADASCVWACPVNCIHPAPGEPGFGTAEMVHIDPQSCVDCGACTSACPVGAIKPEAKLTDAELPFRELNADYFAAEPHADRAPLAVVPPQRRLPAGSRVRVAVVGAGPAAMYAADELLRHEGVSVDVFDRLPTPYGLVRAGVAPDHPNTRQVTRLFRTIEDRPGFGYRLNVEVGRDVDHDELRRHYHGVIYAVGAAADRSLGIPGEELPGSVSATAVVGWYNGHPDHQDTYVDLGSGRVVVVGNGNVALDVARILTADPGELAGTDIADLPLATLRGSRVREVVLLGRRGPAQAAFTVPELLGLLSRPGVEVVVDNGGEPIEVVDTRTRLLASLPEVGGEDEGPPPGRRRIVLGFRSAPVRVLGGDSVAGLEVARTELHQEDGDLVARRTDQTGVIATPMVIRSVGYRGRPVPGLPFDEARGMVPHDHGRVQPGTYVAGWIKRGPTGFIGTNKTCAAETVSSLLEDVDRGGLAEPQGSAADFADLLRSRSSDVVDLEGWRAIDALERSSASASGRPRVKLVERDELVRVARC